jgi:hypothetical protein
MRKHWHAIKKRVRELAFEAIEDRKSKRRYIAWFEDEIEKLIIVQQQQQQKRSAQL